ncbi:MAG TPA: carbohydrate ABC transporter permease [Candidatus Eisenbergiella stercorigallinarum]|uniref:Carbohydrate ABC transporter permease n=1 Tax=Candidatus Eisenbergiella stercorigallinarum TaxID=2838557 RepID=A0A9D2R0Z0_9FIRM|nr:carbohydrate ABC transporter permease [Candidatus Eisenbergiella stercorigallinarum]
MKKIRISHILIYILLILLTLICVVPFYIMIINATHSTNELYTGLSVLPGSHLMENIKNMNERVNMLQGFFNSFLISVCSTALSIYFGTMTAYGLFEYRFKLRKLIYVVLMISLMVPGQLGIIGLFKLCNSLGLLNTYWPIILPSFANATTIFFVMQYLESSMSEELLDSARIDGAGEVRIFHSFVLPLSKPALSTMCIFNFVSYWNNFFTPMILLFDDDKFTVPLLINNMNSGMLQDLGAKYAAIAVSIVPIIVVYCFISKSLTKGMMAGAIKS